MYKFKLLSVWILASVLFGACSSDDSTETQTTEPAEVPVTFTVSTITVEDQPMNTRASTRAATASSGEEISNVINEIHYFIYSGEVLKKDGTIQFDPKTETPPTDFGSFKVNLSPGTYSIYIFAGGKGSGTMNFQSMSPIHINMNTYYNDRELFYYTGEFTVENKADQHDISLSRQCAALRINITESVPENVGKVEFKIQDYPDWHFRVNSFYSNLEYQTYQASFTDGKMDLFDYYFMAFPKTVSSDTRNFSFLIYDKSNTLLSEKKLSITISKNHRTVISGNLFSALNADELTISVNDIWDDDISVVIE